MSVFDFTASKIIIKKKLSLRIFTCTSIPTLLYCVFYISHTFLARTYSSQKYMNKKKINKEFTDKEETFFHVYEKKERKKKTQKPVDSANTTEK